MLIDFVDRYVRLIYKRVRVILLSDEDNYKKLESSSSNSIVA